MNMEFLMQELCKKIRRMDRKSFNNMIKRLSAAYEKSHKPTYDEELYKNVLIAIEKYQKI